MSGIALTSTDCELLSKKAAEGSRTPRRWRVFGERIESPRVLECGCPLPLFSGAGCARYFGAHRCEHLSVRNYGPASFSRPSSDAIFGNKNASRSWPDLPTFVR